MRSRGIVRKNCADNGPLCADSSYNLALLAPLIVLPWQIACFTHVREIALKQARGDTEGYGELHANVTTIIALLRACPTKLGADAANSLANLYNKPSSCLPKDGPRHSSYHRVFTAVVETPGSTVDSEATPPYAFEDILGGFNEHELMTQLDFATGEFVAKY